MTCATAGEAYIQSMLVAPAMMVNLMTAKIRSMQKQREIRRARADGARFFNMTGQKAPQSQSHAGLNRVNRLHLLHQRRIALSHFPNQGYGQLQRRTSPAFLPGGEQGVGRVRGAEEPTVPTVRPPQLMPMSCICTSRIIDNR